MHECTICYKRKKHFSELNCGHELCTVCWNKWKHRQLAFYDKKYPTCPTCRQEQIPKRPDEWKWKMILLAFLFWVLKDSPILAKILQKV